MVKHYNQKYLIKGAIRRLFARSPAVVEVKNASIHPTKKGPKGGKQYVCADCGECFGGGNVQVDHIFPVVPIGMSINDLSYEDIVNNIFVEPNMLQVLCKPCHKKKSANERKLRKKICDELKKMDKTK